MTDTPAEVFLSLVDIYAETEMTPSLLQVMPLAQIITGGNDDGCKRGLTG